MGKVEPRFLTSFLQISGKRAERPPITIPFGEGRRALTEPLFFCSLFLSRTHAHDINALKCGCERVGQCACVDGARSDVCSGLESSAQILGGRYCSCCFSSLTTAWTPPTQCGNSCGRSMCSKWGCSTPTCMKPGCSRRKYTNWEWSRRLRCIRPRHTRNNCIKCRCN